jgi:monoamine oxidase
LDFEFGDDTKWYCILGGAQQLAKKMEAKVSHKPVYNSLVTAIRAIDNMEVEVEVETSSVKTTKKYRAVFNTTTFGCLRRMDLSNAGLNYSTKQAIRSLGYGAAAKVAIKFKRAWWIHDLGNYNVKMGGIGHSDLNIRTCVYPSYNIYDDETKTAILLVSYTWQEDSHRLASLMSTNPNHAQKVKDEAVLKELLFHELARLHRNENMTEEKLYSLISDNYIDHHAFDWYKDPNTVGAFAFFRPQQFTCMWNKLIQQAGDVVIVGEAASPHHAWVVGALESVVHGIHAWLGSNVEFYPEFAEAAEILEDVEDGNPFVGLPPYMEKKTSQWHSLIGIFQREEHLGNIQSLTSLFTQLIFKANWKS